MDRPLPPLDQRTVPAVLAAAVRDRPSAPALRDSDRALSYAEVDQRARIFAGGFSQLGAGAGRRVLLMLDNHVDYVLCWLGVTLGGGVEVPINTAYQTDLLVHLINDSEAEHLVIEDRYCDRIAAVRHELKFLRTVVVRGGDGGALTEESLTVVPFSDLTAAQPAPTRPAKPWDLLAIMYTSGTTGPSKGVLVTQSQAYGYCTPALYGAADHNDTVLVSLPLFHVGGQWAGVYNSFIAGAEAVVLDRFHATTYWDHVRRYGITYTLLLGAMAGFLYRQPARPDDADNSLRRALMVPVIPEFSDFATRFGVTLGTAYGSTEGSTSIYTPFGSLETVACGRSRPDFDVKIVDENDVDVPQGQVGELVVRPSEPWSVMAGYHGRPDATAAAWRNQWLHTGDAFTQDENGRFFFVDRLSDSIRRRGENISSFEVERAIDTHDDVLESAVVGVASEFTEQDVLAVVVLRPGATVGEQELWEHLADRLPYFMVPRYIEFVGELPKTPTQKLQKNVVRSRGVTAETWDRESAG